MAGETRMLAEFISAASFEDLPAEVVHHAKRVILDHLGIATLGATSISAKKVVQTVKQLGGKEESTIIGEMGRFSPVWASLANGTMAYSQMIDDIYAARGWAHPGNAVISAALALTESRDVSGADFITAVVMGYEGTCRATDAGGPSVNDRGFRISATNAHFGAASAGAKVLGLDVEGCCHALGLAGAMASGVWEEGVVHSLAQPLHAGRASSNGVLATLLAANGLAAGDTIWEGKEGRRGYLDVFSDDPDPRQLVDGLGSTYMISRIGFKFHPAAGGISPAIDAMLSLAEQHAISAQDVEKITVRTHKLEVEHHDNPDPDTTFTAIQSNQYCVARALVDGIVLASGMAPERLREPEVRKVMGKISIEVDPQHEAAFPSLMSATVVVQTVDGKVYEETAKAARGMPANPASDEDLEAKFHSLVSGVIPKSRANEIRALVWSLEEVPHIEKLASLLRP